MSAPLEGSKGVSGELKTRDGSDSQKLNVEDVGGPHSLIISRTEDAILDDGDATSISSTKSNEMKMMSDDNDDFNPDLPTEYKAPVEADRKKDSVIGESKADLDKGKTKKKVPESTEKSSTESSEASKPKTSMDTPLSGQTIANIESSSSHHNEAESLQENPLFLVTMTMKKDFHGNGHTKSGKYYLPKGPTNNKEGCKSELYASLSAMARLYTCGATYQWSHPNVLRLMTSILSGFNIGKTPIY